MSTPVRNISDTALWIAVHRAHESERRDALFHDPYARRLAGPRGETIAAALRHRHPWAMVVRTLLFDEAIARQVAAGADMVVNLAAGLDSRPWRMDLPRELTWVEVDLPDLLAYKQDVLRDDVPRCRLEQVACDLSDARARRALVESLGARARRAVVVTEGLLLYLTDEQVAALATDLAAVPSFTRWMFDLGSPGILKLLTQELGAQLEAAGAPFRFAPPEGPAFFAPYGWVPEEVHSYLKRGRGTGRLPLLLRLGALFPEPKDGRAGDRPWSALCVMRRR